jgi:hypothetical protein
MIDLVRFSCLHFMYFYLHVYRSQWKNYKRRLTYLITSDKLAFIKFRNIKHAKKFPHKNVLLWETPI